MTSKRDENVLIHILKYCNETQQIVNMFDTSVETMKQNPALRNSCAMCILQIGELTTHFSKEFLQKNTKMPWANMKRMRNIAAHHYGDFDLNILYDTVMNDIPLLKEYCTQLLA